MPLYNLAPARLGQVNQLDTTSNNNRIWYNGININLTARLRNGATILAGTDTGRTVSRLCDVADPNALRFCDQSQFSIPFLTNVKISGSDPLPFGLRISGSFQSQTNSEIVTTDVVNKSIVPTLTQSQVSIRLNEPGSGYLPRVNLLALSLRRTFKSGRVLMEPRLDFYNMLNVNNVVVQNNTYGPALGRVITVVDPRLARIGLDVRF
jgi:hypothetical protein